MNDRPSPLNEQTVWDAAEELQAQGVTPTQQSVHEYLGRGSMGTINRHLRTWKAQDRERRRLPVIEIPDMPEEITSLVSDMWKGAISAAGKIEHDKLEADRKAVEAERSKAKAAVDEAEHRLQETRLRLDTESTAHVALKAAYDELQDKHDARGEEIRSLSETVAALKTDVRNLTAQLEESRQSLVTTRAAHAATLEREQARSDALERRLVAQIEEQRQHAAQAKAEAAERAREQHKAEERADQAQTRVDNALARIDEANALVASLRADLKETETARRSAERSATEIGAKAVSTKQELAQRTRDLDALAAQNRQLAKEISRRRHEMAGLIDPELLMDWIGNGLKPPAGKAFDNIRLRDLGRVIERLLPDEGRIAQSP